jgi:hypothetical protein
VRYEQIGEVIGSTPLIRVDALLPEDLLRHGTISLQVPGSEEDADLIQDLKGF